MSWYEDHVEPQVGAETANYQGPAVLSSPKSALTNPLTWVLAITGGIFVGTLFLKRGESKAPRATNVMPAQVFRIEPGLTHEAAAARAHEIAEGPYRGVSYNPHTGLLTLV